MIRTQIQLTEEQAQKLKALADERQCSMAELVRQGVDALFCRATSIDMTTRRQRAMAAAGRFRSGQTDISANHDDYLAEAYQS
jgi:hypothetical protein